MAIWLFSNNRLLMMSKSTFINRTVDMIDYYRHQQFVSAMLMVAENV